MASIFSKDPGMTDGPTPEELMEAEFQAGQAKPSNPIMDLVKYACVLLIFGLIGLYVLDPFYFALYKQNIINSYLYLKETGNKTDTARFVSSEFFTPVERILLNGREGTFGDLYNSITEAREAGEEALAWLKEIQNMHAGELSEVSTINYFRGLLFVNVGLNPPKQWSSMNPSVRPEPLHGPTHSEQKSWRDKLQP